MSRRTKRMSRKELEEGSPRDPTKKSKYALKVSRRKRLARSLGLRDNVTYPEIWVHQELLKEALEYTQ